MINQQIYYKNNGSYSAAPQYTSGVESAFQQIILGKPVTAMGMELFVESGEFDPAMFGLKVGQLFKLSPWAAEAAEALISEMDMALTTLATETTDGRDTTEDTGTAQAEAQALAALKASS